MSDIKIASLTHPGQVRPNNEDSVATAPEIGLVVLADGMGGHQAGEVASGLAVDLIIRHVSAKIDGKRKEPDGVVDQNSHEAQSLFDAILLANSAIHEASTKRPECAGMGSTVVTALFHENTVSVGHVGDSRLYRLRSGELEQLTQDHSVVQELLSRGLITKEEAFTAYNKNLVTRALGVEADVKPDLNEHEFKENDLYLLCSDGLNDVLSDHAIKEILINADSDLDKLADKLVKAANENGGPDNVSVILIKTGGTFNRK